MSESHDIMKRQTRTDKAFAAGYGVAVAGLARDHFESDLAGFLLGDSGLPLNVFERCGLDDYDLDVIRSLFESGLATSTIKEG